MQNIDRHHGNASAHGRTIAILVTSWYNNVVDGLREGAISALLENGAVEDDIALFQIPGAFEMPLAALKIAQTGRYDGLVCLGAVIRGETPHFEFIAGEAAAGLSTVARDTGVPIGFGILTCDTIEQALARSEPGPNNKGAEAALAVVGMIDLSNELQTN